MTNKEQNQELDKESKERAERLRFICFMLYKLKEKNSWCSLLHIQKSCYIAQKMLGVPLGYDFAPYKYGPYSFNLPDDISVALSNFVLLAKEKLGYGPSYELDEGMTRYVENNNNYKYAKQVEFIADWFMDKPAKELGKLTSAYMVTQRMQKDQPINKQIAELMDWKDYLKEEEAKKAIETVKDKQKEATKFLKKLAKQQDAVDKGIIQNTA